MTPPTNGPGSDPLTPVPHLDAGSFKVENEDINIGPEHSDHGNLKNFDQRFLVKAAVLRRGGDFEELIHFNFD
jgi:hypothetical protein